jgi:gas vesicle protein GvpL/GvpF
MPWYVFALVDAVPEGTPGKGLTGNLSLREVPGGLAVVERRADVPPMEFGTLQKHHAVVARLCERVPAILPVRFGTLLEGEEIEEVLQERDGEIAEAFSVVRRRVQFTWRRTKDTKEAKDTKEPKDTKERRTKEQVRDPRGEAETGTEYLLRAARAKSPTPPPAFRALRSKVAPLVAAERYQPAAAQLPASLYHLVDRSAIERYEVIGEAIAHASPGLRMSGPFPPFAFAPEIL